MRRASGILMPIASLPSPYGIGALGKEARAFADFLKKAGQTYWQMLPLGHTGYGNSPYQVFSMYAGNPYFIDLDLLVEEGLLRREEAEAADWGADPRRVDYGALWIRREPALRRAYARGAGLSGQVAQFREENPWLEDYALFMALKGHFGGISWLRWGDEAIRHRRQWAMDAYKGLLKDRIDYTVFVQFLFFRQWTAFKRYVSDQGIRLIGDLPIYVSPDSVEVWSMPECFLLDQERRPTHVAGVPPDYFSEDGQLWGNPLYDWDVLKADGYRLWMDRFQVAAGLFDAIRIDHFRGFESYWKVPAGDETARGGQWAPGPGLDFVRRLTARFPDTEIIAEDLGEKTQGLAEFVEASGLPGIKVLQFAFDSAESTAEMPHEYPRRSVCFTGTHDNTTAGGWAQALSEEDIRFAGAYLGFEHRGDAVWALIRGGMISVSDLFIAQMQDYLALPADCRMNLPGTSEGNWEWRMLKGENTAALADKIAYLTSVCRR
jgi:4-alpha-glucanotransferase